MADQLAIDIEDDPEDVVEGSVQLSAVQRAVVTGTDWTTETVVNQIRRGNIQMNPAFQRRDAWTQERKSRYIESLMLGLPIPQLVLAEDRRRRGAFIVLDGKQRLLSLRQFAAEANDTFRQLKLRRLDILNDLEGKSLVDLEGSDRFREQLDEFYNQPIRTVVVRSWPSEEFLNLVFLRLNTGSVQLSPQELRQALHPGPFTDFLDQFAADSAAVLRALRLKEPDFRMRDVELLLRFFAYDTRLLSYRGDLKRFLDETVSDFNRRWGSEEQVIRAVARRCEAAIEATFSTFGEDAFFRWDGRRYERRFNRAVFDVMTYYFAEDRVAAEAAVKRIAVQEGFKALCEEDASFREAIQTTTKTMGATYLRLYTWGTALSRILEIPVRSLGLTPVLASPVANSASISTEESGNGDVAV